MDTTGNQHFGPNSGVSGIFLVGVALCKCTVEYNMAAFIEFSLAVHWQGGLSRGKYYK